MKEKHVFIYLLLILFLTACNSSHGDSAEENLTIYTSIYPIQFLSEEITGELAKVKTIYPPGVDAHTYEPTSREITEIANGDAFIYLGAGMESFAEHAVDALQSQDVKFIEVGEDTSLFRENTVNDQHDHEHSDLDPHIWLDPLRMIEIGELITDRLTELDPDNEGNYQENFAVLKDKLTALDEEFITTLQMKKQKQIIVSHAAYGYWEERYGIEQIAISGLSSSDEPSQKELADIAKLAEQQKINYVIFDQTDSNRLATIIQDYIGADKRVVHNLETITEEDIQADENYLTLMKQNLDVLDEATN